MAGYSNTPLVKKLGIVGAQQLLLLNAPPDFDETLGALPPGVDVRRTLRGKSPVDLIVSFVRRRAELEAQLDSVRARMAPAAGYWVAWPKRSAKVPTDV